MRPLSIRQVGETRRDVFTEAWKEKIKIKTSKRLKKGDGQQGNSEKSRRVAKEKDTKKTKRKEKEDQARCLHKGKDGRSKRGALKNTSSCDQ